MDSLRENLYAGSTIFSFLKKGRQLSLLLFNDAFFEYVIFLGIKVYKFEHSLEIELLIHPASNLLSHNYRQ